MKRLHAKKIMIGLGVGVLAFIGIYLNADEFEISFGITNQTSRIRIPSDTSHYYQIWATENLMGNSWFPTGMTLGVSETQTWNQTISTQRYYRAVEIVTTNPDDEDNDGLDDVYELNNSPLNPLNADTDGDSLSDGDEVNSYGSNPNSTDSDSDGLSDADEVSVYDTNPAVADSDGDDLNDSQEISSGSNPNNSSDVSLMVREARLKIAEQWELVFGESLVLTNSPGSVADLQDLDHALTILSTNMFAEAAN